MKIIKLSDGSDCLVDDSDFPALSSFRWHRKVEGNYATRRIGRCGSGGYVWMHRVIMCPADDEVVDHIDHNPLNNQRSNLRVCFTSENTKNCLKTKEKRFSQYKGVRPTHRLKKPFGAHIRVNYKYISLGSFSTEAEAALAYNAGAVKYFGRFACLNTITP